MEAAARHLKVRCLLQWRFPDGALSEHGADLRRELETLVRELRPDLMITFGPDGLYGHPDHVACSAAVTEVRSASHPAPSLWYVALPRLMRHTLVRLGSLPEAPTSAVPAPKPSRAVFVFPVLTPKLRAWRAHRSQSRAVGAGPGRLFPSWVIPLLQPFEFFCEVPPP
jgi:LmbE family N-acetylglucosaminyl deacetylase